MFHFYFRVCCRSPLIPARPAFSAEQLNSSASSNIWTNSTTGQNGTVIEFEDVKNVKK